METQIIDFHTHIYPVALARRAMEVVRREGDPYDSLPIRENLLRRMEEADISLSVVQPVVSQTRTWCSRSQLSPRSWDSATKKPGCSASRKV